MSVRETRRPAPPPPELEGEDEVDLGRYWSAIAARWWLPLLGLLAGALIGYLVAVGGSQTYRAQAVVSLGTPLAVGGGVLPSVQTNAAEKLAAIGIIGIAEQRRSVVTQDLLSTRPLLTQAETVERGRVLARAAATKTTARSKRNSAVVGGGPRPP